MIPLKLTWAEPFQIEKLESIPSLWDHSPQEILSQIPQISFKDASLNLQRYYFQSQMFLGQNESHESYIITKNHQIRSFHFIFYNRGDIGNMTSTQYFSHLKKISTSLDQWFNQKGVLQKEKKITSSIKKRQKIWFNSQLRAYLEWSYQGTNAKGFEQAEYIRLILFPPKNNFNNQTSSYFEFKDQKQNLSAFEIKKNVKHENFRHFIQNISMIDQGKKGYCVTATMERILRYFQKEIDQHELSQLANTDAKKGTSNHNFISAASKISKNYGIQLKKFYLMDQTDFQKMFKNYQRNCKKIHQSPFKEYPKNRSWEEWFKQLKFSILLETRHQDSFFKKFKNTIVENIDQGIPLCWTVFVGIAPETPSIHNVGAHMRMIIGYDTQSKSIIYTDSWGPGHEFKTMRINHAWCITTGLFCITPPNWNFNHRKNSQNIF